MAKIKNNPAVSIIVATYNREEYICKAIDSVLNQSYKNFEIIIIDDGSTDNTKNILKPYLELGSIKYIYQENKGSVIARDNAIKNAQGKYIAILDSDDFWFDGNKLEKQVKFFEKNPDYVLVGGGIIKIDNRGSEVGRFLPPEKDADIRKLILLNNIFIHSASMFKKDAWEKVGGYCKQEGDIPKDWNLWLKLGTIGKFYNIQEYFVYYLEGGQNTSYYNIRKNFNADFRLRKKFRHDYPNFWRAFFLGKLYYFYSFFPFRKQFYPALSRLRRLVFGRLPYK